MNAKSFMANHRLTPVGEGSRRICYQVDDRYCVKFYRDVSGQKQNVRFSIRWEIAARRYLRLANVNYREWRYHRKLRETLPPELMAVFPEHTEVVLAPGKGWGIAESLVMNADGSKPRLAIKELKRAHDPKTMLAIFNETVRLLCAIIRHGVCFFDLSNILVQWREDGTFRLRIVDFEPDSRAPMPGLTHVPGYVRAKTRRRALRMLPRLRALLEAGGTDKDEAARAAAWAETCLKAEQPAPSRTKSRLAFHFAPLRRTLLTLFP